MVKFENNGNVQEEEAVFVMNEDKNAEELVKVLSDKRYDTESVFVTNNYDASDELIAPDDDEDYEEDDECDCGCCHQEAGEDELDKSVCNFCFTNGSSFTMFLPELEEDIIDDVITNYRNCIASYVTSFNVIILESEIEESCFTEGGIVYAADEYIHSMGININYDETCADMTVKDKALMIVNDALILMRAIYGGFVQKYIIDRHDMLLTQLSQYEMLESLTSDVMLDKACETGAASVDDLRTVIGDLLSSGRMFNTGAFDDILGKDNAFDSNDENNEEE